MLGRISLKYSKIANYFVVVSASLRIILVLNLSCKLVHG